MNIKSILIAIISIICISSCKKDIGNTSNEEGTKLGTVTIRANDTWLVAGRNLNGDILHDNQVNLVGAGSIFWTITVATGENVPIECYLSIEDPNKSGTEKTIIKTSPAPLMIYDATKKQMTISTTLNVAIMASGRQYIGHIVFNGPNTQYHQQTDYIVYR